MKKSTDIFIATTILLVSCSTNDCVPTALSNNKLILMYGYYDTFNTGHIWIIDGCNYYSRKSQDYVSSNGIDWEEYGEATYVTREYNHINWGWDGYNNGYFNDGVFCTYNYVSLDTSYSSDYAYNFNNRLNYFTVYH